MADLFSYSLNAIKNIEASKVQIRAEAAESEARNDQVAMKKKRVGHKLTHPDLDEGVFKFVEMAREKRFPVQPNFFLNVASFLASKMGLLDFKASQGWYRGFCTRHAIYFKKLHGNYIFIQLFTKCEKL